MMLEHPVVSSIRSMAHKIISDDIVICWLDLIKRKKQLNFIDEPLFLFSSSSGSTNSSRFNFLTFR